MTTMLRVPRSRGALSGVLLVLLGIWGGLIAFVGPSFHYAYTPDRAWAYTSGRLWLEVLPAAATVIGGLILLASSYRPTALFGGWLAALGGAWFAVGNVLAPAWHGGSVTAGTPVGGTLTRAVEQIGFFTGLGIAIVLLAAMALGRLSVISVRDARLAERTAEAAATGTAAGEPTAASEPVTTDGLATASEPVTTRGFALRHPAASGGTAETDSPPAQPATPDAGPADVSADPAAERVDSTSAAQ
jgi:hypothetical protein